MSDDSKTPVDKPRALHPSVKDLLRWFRYDHLQEPLAKVSKPFADLAYQLVEDLPSCAELTVALRKLLEAKDCAVRARLSD